METNTQKTSSIILSHQRVAFESLLRIANATFFIQRKSFPLRPRSNTLIVGPSGSGKTHVARAVAAACNVPYLSITAGNWLLLGSGNRGGKATWPLVCQFLRKNYSAEGVVILIDEVDKISSSATSSWDDHLRSELYGLLDLSIPEGISDSDGDMLDPSAVEKAQEVLSERCLLISAGAFQHIFEQRAQPKVGFGTEPEGASQEPDLNELAQTIPRELANRFRSQLILLPPLKEADYRAMLQSVATKMPTHFQQTFLRMGNARMREAMRCRQGCRFLEELILDVVMEERSQLITEQRQEIAVPPLSL